MTRHRRARGSRGRFVSLALLSFFACTEDPASPPPRRTAECDGVAGPAHSGHLNDDVWGSLDGPHVLLAATTIGQLVLEPGTRVCAAPGVSLIVTRLEGPEPGLDPAVLTAVDAANPWGGVILRGDGAVVRDVTVEHAQSGITTQDLWLDRFPLVVLERLHVRRIQERGALIINGVLRNSTVEMACMAAEAAESCAAVQSYGNFTFEETTIRGSGGDGVRVGDRAHIRLLGGRIEGSAGGGLIMYSPRGLALLEARPLTITGNGYPGSVFFDHLPLLLPDEQALLGWTGNLRGYAASARRKPRRRDANPSGAAMVGWRDQRGT